MIWLIADILNGLMALPNLIALVLLSPTIFKATTEFRKKYREQVNGIRPHESKSIKPSEKSIENSVLRALEEDIGDGDRTAALIDPLRKITQR